MFVFFLVPSRSFAHGRCSNYLKTSVVPTHPRRHWPWAAQPSPRFLLIYWVSSWRWQERLTHSENSPWPALGVPGLIYCPAGHATRFIFIRLHISVFCFMASGWRVIFRTGSPHPPTLFYVFKFACFLSVFLSFLFVFGFLVRLGFVWCEEEGSSFLFSEWLPSPSRSQLLGDPRPHRPASVLPGNVRPFRPLPSRWLPHSP